jgi:GntR family transcriptional regulator
VTAGVLAPFSLEFTHGEPLPLQIARLLSEAIEAGQLEVGARLPSEPKLAEMFKVSRNTTREALRLLMAEGIVESRKGIGTFVRRASAPVLPVGTGLEELTSTTRMIQAAGCTPGSRDYELTVVAAPDEVARALGLDEGAFAYRVTRVRLADERPVMLCVEYLPMARVDESVMRAFDGSSLFSFLERSGMRVAVARAVVRPVLPTPEIAAALSVRETQPLLLLLQTHYDAADRPFLYSENMIDSRFLEYQVRRIPSAEPFAKEVLA